MTCRRGSRLPQLRIRTFLSVCVCLLAVCLGFGLTMRASLTDYSSDLEALDKLPFVVRPASADRLELRSDDEVLSVMTSELGDIAGEYSLAEGAELLGMSRENLSDGAENVITATFMDRRSYGYQTFVSEVKVTSVVKGAGISVGDLISLYEGFEIVEPENYTGLGQFTDDREVRPAGMTPNYYGAGLLREGGEYLLFLNPKRQSGVGDNDTAQMRYCQIASPYGHVPVDVLNHPEKVRESPRQQGGGAQDERISFEDACGFDMFVQDEAAKETYLNVCEQVLSETLSEV